MGEMRSQLLISERDRRLLITGVPATGKTTVGDYLQTSLGFKHFNVEGNESEPQLNLLRQLFWANDIKGFLDKFGTDYKLVITWGFVPDHQLSLRIIESLQNHKFQFIWFTAEIALARSAFRRRLEETGCGNTQEFEIQMSRISNLRLNRFRDVRIIETLTNKGRKTPDGILREIFAL